MARAWACLRVHRFHQTPFAGGDAVPVEIVNSVVAIISAKNVDAAVVDDRCMPVSWRRGLGSFLRDDFDPVVGLEAEFEKIIAPVGSVVPSENIKVVFERH